VCFPKVFSIRETGGEEKERGGGAPTLERCGPCIRKNPTPLRRLRRNRPTSSSFGESSTKRGGKPPRPRAFKCPCQNLGIHAIGRGGGRGAFSPPRGQRTAANAGGGKRNIFVVPSAVRAKEEKRLRARDAERKKTRLIAKKETLSN